jgi:hypothetical protein
VAQPAELRHLSPRIVVGQVASGDKVVNDQSAAFFASVIRSRPKLVREQILIAAGQPLSLSQQDVVTRPDPTSTGFGRFFRRQCPFHPDQIR